MRRALVSLILLCLAVSHVKAQDSAKVVPKHSKVAEMNTTGTISSDSRSLLHRLEHWRPRCARS